MFPSKKLYVLEDLARLESGIKAVQRKSLGKRPTLRTSNMNRIVGTSTKNQRPGGNNDHLLRLQMRDFTRKTKVEKRLKKYSTIKSNAMSYRLSSFLLHSLRPSSGSLFSASTNNTHTEYQIVLENFRTGQLWQVERRFNDFASFRENVEKIFQAPHCHYCAHIKQQIHDLGVLFPPKKLWGSMRKSVIKYRAHQFFHYLNELLRLATEQYALNCRMVSVSLTSHVRQFLTIESTRYNGIPGTTNTGKEIPCMLRELSQDRIALATINEGICSSLCEDFEGEETYWKIHLHDDEENQTEPEIDDSSRGSSEEREEQEQNPAEEIIFFSF